MSRLFTEDEITDFLTSNCPEQEDVLTTCYFTGDSAREAWQGWVEHMEAGGFTIGVETGIQTEVAAPLRVAAETQQLLDDQRRRMRVEVLNDLLTLTDAGVELDSAALRELVGECEAATEVVGR